MAVWNSCAWISRREPWRQEGSKVEDTIKAEQKREDCLGRDPKSQSYEPQLLLEVFAGDGVGHDGDKSVEDGGKTGCTCWRLRGSYVGDVWKERGFAGWLADRLVGRLGLLFPDWLWLWALS